MGASTSNTKYTQSSQTDDIDDDAEDAYSDEVCMRNPVIRTVVLCILLVIFYSMTIPSVLSEYQRWSASLLDEDIANADLAVKSWLVILAGAAASLLGSLISILYMLCSSYACDCNRCVTGCTAFISIAGGLLYLIGWILQVAVRASSYRDGLVVMDAGGTLAVIDGSSLSQSDKQQLIAIFTTWIAEALLSSGILIFVGLDILLQFMQSKTLRLFCNLSLLCVVSALIATCYMIMLLQVWSVQDNHSNAIEEAPLEIIITGYTVLLFSALVYVVLYVCTCKCCSCQCKDTCIMRCVLSLAIIAAAIVMVIGYYAWLSNIADAFLQNCEDGNENETECGLDVRIVTFIVYYVGYTMLLGGLCFVWSLDIAYDDILLMHDIHNS